LRTHPLDRVHHVRRLRCKNFTHLPRPGQILIHPIHDLRIMSERFDAVCPGLVIDIILFATGCKIPRSDDNVSRCGRRRKNQCDE
jgi:hypothetical protein